MKIAAYILGLIAFIFFVFSLQKETKEKLLKYQLIANILYMIQYFLLKVNIAAYMDMANILRLSIFLNYNKKRKQIPYYILIILCILIISIGVYSTLHSNNIILSILPAFITLIYTIASFGNNMKIIRYVFLFGAILWFYYNFKVGAYTSALGNIFEFSSALVSIIRYKKSK